MVQAPKSKKALPKQQKLLSVIIPVYNEEEVILETISRVLRILGEVEIRNELILVNDGSTDSTQLILQNIQLKSKIRVINIARNSGHMNAIRVGLEASHGDFIATIDADLQDPPEYLPKMYEILTSTSKASTLLLRNNQIDIVQAYREDRSSDSKLKRSFAKMYYSAARKLTGISLHPNAADFRIMTREVVDELLKVPSNEKVVYRLLIPSLGFNIELFPIVRAQRYAGKSKYTLTKMVALALDSIIGFTYKPLRLLAYIGLITSLILLLGSFLTLIIAIFGSTIPGWPSLVLLLLSINALLFAGIGLLGEYVGRIYELLQTRPGIKWRETNVKN
jgi:glycosyltransferase involved in cell wall biosynthesis